MPESSTGTVGKAFRVLTAVGDQPDGATAGDVARLVDYPFSTAYRLLGTLVRENFLAYDPRDKRYRLGLRIFQLGQRASSSHGFDGMAAPVLRRLTSETEESSLLCVLDGDRFLTVNKVDGPQFRTTTDPGERGPLHTSAAGKALLAFAPDQTREHLLATLDLGPRTARSITDRAALRCELDRVREQGWAGQDEENDVGMVALAVPVLTSNGDLVASVVLAAPVFRHSIATLLGLLPQLRDAAEELGARLPLHR
jgi:DNA-binding IclR family transcriptional regulator